MQNHRSKARCQVQTLTKVCPSFDLKSIYLTECKSRLRILRSAASLYPILHSLLHAVYVTINSLCSLSKLDEALKSGPVREEVHSCLPQC